MIGILRGGLGNQLFQLVGYHAISEASGKRLFIDTSSYSHPRQKTLGRRVEIDSLLEVMRIQKLDPKSQLSQRISSMSHTLIRLASDQSGKIGELSWLLASEHKLLGHSSLKRFANCRHVDGYFAETWAVPFFRKSFEVVIEAMLSDRTNLLNLSGLQIRGDSVSVHVRLGDMRQARPEAILPFPRIAAELKRVATPGSRATLFSDEQDVAALELNRIGVELESDSWQGTPYETLLALSMARRVVASASTFSWWAGILAHSAGGVVSFPNVRDTQESLISIPSEWERF